MWSYAGVQRSGAGLRHAASVLAGWQADTLEDRNLLDLAHLVVDAALAREESRGAHYRSDFPAARPELASRRRVSRDASAPQTAPAAASTAEAVPSTRLAAPEGAPAC
jgi:L-aspartate oxidase